MSIIYLVRHAHAIWNPDEQRPLSPQGQNDAQTLIKLLGDLPISTIYASSARRAYQTVEPLAKYLQLPIHQRDDLMERRLSSQPVADFLAAVRFCWQHPELALPGGESNHVAQTRGVQALAEINHRHHNQHIIIGTHGNLLALILQYYDPRIDFQFWHTLSMPDVYRLDLTTTPVPPAQHLQ